MKKIDEENNCTFEYLNYMNSLDKKELLNFAIGADLLVDKLNNTIDKAIEYIKNNACYSNEGNTCCDDLYCGDCDKVLDILKGADKE